MSEISNRIRDYVNDYDVSDHYGAWGILRRDQRRQIRKLCDTCDMYEKTADDAMRTVDCLKRTLAAQELEHSQALQDKARECNMAVDKICLAHREEIRALQEKHEAELAAAKREVAWKIFAELDTMDIRIVRLLDAIKYMDLVKKYEYKNN